MRLVRRHPGDGEGHDPLKPWMALAEDSNETVVVITDEGIIVGGSPGAALHYGRTAGQIIGQHVSALVAPEDQDVLQAQLQAIRKGDPVGPQKSSRILPDGTLLEVETRVAPIRDAGGAVVGAWIADRDLTEERRLALTLDRTVAALEEALERTREAEARSGRFLADAAHQLRTPIAGISAGAETLLRGPAPDERERLLADLVREAARAGRLVNSLLRIAQLEEGEPLVPAPCDLLAVCADEVDRAWSYAPHLDVSLTAGEMPPEPPHLDERAVREILANLLDNARRHAKEKIAMSIHRAGETVEIRITDDGPGIADEMVERAFERFASLDGRGGSGLGLPIARDLARSHGGDLSYEGGAFVLRLSAAPTAATQPG